MALKLEEHKEDILQRFAAKESCSSIAADYEVNLQCVTNLVKKYTGLTNLRPSQGNTRYFQNIDTAAKAYLLGFIAADGCIQNFTKTSIGLSITIHIKDRCVLDFLKSEVGNEHELQLVRAGAHIRYTLTNKDLVSDLENLGIGQRKSLTLGNFIENVPKHLRGYAILGYFDGDGSISVISKSKQYVQIRCTEDVAMAIVTELGIDSYHLSKCDAIPSLVIGAKRNVAKFAALYEGCPIFLPRKKAKFDLVIY